MINSISAIVAAIVLSSLLAETNGKDQLAYFWAKAMDAGRIREDAQIVEKARAAMEAAKQRGYQVSSAQ